MRLCLCAAASSDLTGAIAAGNAGCSDAAVDAGELFGVPQWQQLALPLYRVARMAVLAWSSQARWWCMHVRVRACVRLPHQRRVPDCPAPPPLLSTQRVAPAPGSKAKLFKDDYVLFV